MGKSHITAWYNPLYTPKQLGFFHCSIDGFHFRDLILFSSLRVHVHMAQVEALVNVSLSKRYEQPWALVFHKDLSEKIHKNTIHCLYLHMF